MEGVAWLIWLDLILRSCVGQYIARSKGIIVRPLYLFDLIEISIGITRYKERC
jgi:hypothetical protein